MADGIAATSRRRWPAPLRPGDTVAAIAPAGVPDRAGADRGGALLASWGLEVQVLPAAFDGHHSGFLAADDERRAADLNAAFADERFAGVMCIRGGYGSQRLLDRIDTRTVAANPKVFVGFSDITALHVALGQRARLVTFHGPNLQWNQERLDSGSVASLRAALVGAPAARLQGEPLHPGRAQGPLVGGNLTLLSTLCGTADALDTANSVLLLEDTEEAPYRIDRALTHLRRAGTLDQVVGLAFDDFHACGGPPDEATARQVVASHAAMLDIPAVYGLPLGHGPGQRTVPLGAEVALDGDAGVLEVLAP